MDELQQYREKVDAYWPQIDEYFDGLPANLYRQGRLLRENLAVAHSETGDFHDILRKPDDHPLLHYHLWLLDDLGAGEDDGRTVLELNLFAASVFGLCVAAVQRGMRASDSFIDAGYIGLSESMTRRGVGHFAAVVDTESPFWDRHRALWDTAADAAAGDDPRTDRIQAPFLLSGLAALHATGHDDRSAGLLDMLTHLNNVLATRHDLLAVRRDLGGGAVSRPVGQMMESTGLPQSTEASAEALLGSLLLSGAVETIAPQWRADIEEYATGARQLGLPTFERYAEVLDDTMESIRVMLRVPSGVIPTGAAPPQFESASSPLPEAIAMAARFLSADPTMREAWEVHRWGMADAPEVTARFPAGLVIEVLGNHGTDVADLVDAFYQQAVDKRFAYYDHPDLPYVETDTLGTMLRLFPYSKQTGWHRRLLDEYLDLLEARVDGGNRLPVWLAQGPADDLLLGEGCGTVEANLLRGLIEYDADRLAPLIELPAQRLIEDFRRRGAAITVNYPRPYLLAVLADLFADLGDTAPWEHLVDQIEIEATRARVTPLTAACLMLASSHPQTTERVDDRWATVVLKAQSFDGGWAAEPMFFAPNRGRNTTWFSSRLVTSAVCYDALTRWQARTPA